jgi:nucleoside-triphosphatase THEP1
MTLYGNPGIGKTTLAFSASRPLLLDFDGGAQRAMGRKDIVRVRSWADVAEIAQADVANYDTIILDTVGRALEFLAADLVKTDPKLARKSGELAMQGYGALKTAFAQWLGRIRTFGKHVILIAHEKEEKDGDTTIVRVDAMGATRVEVIRLSDLVGFVAAVNGKRTLDFNPTDKHTGKNCAGFDVLEIPHIAQSPAYLAGIMAEALSRMNAATDAQRESEAKLAQWLVVIGELETAEEVNRAIQTIPQDIIVKRALAGRAKTLGLVWSGSTFAYPKEKELADAAA